MFLDTWLTFTLHIQLKFVSHSFQAINRDRKLFLVSLYFLIWGEAANVRFLPECICYIFHHVSFLLLLMFTSCLLVLPRCIHHLENSWSYLLPCTKLLMHYGSCMVPTGYLYVVDNPSILCCFETTMNEMSLKDPHWGVHPWLTYILDD